MNYLIEGLILYMKEKILNLLLLTGSVVTIFFVIYFIAGVAFRSVAVINHDTEQKSLQRIADTLERIEVTMDNQKYEIKNRR